MGIIIRKNWLSLLLILFHWKFTIYLLSIIIPLKSCESMHSGWVLYTKNKDYNQFMVLRPYTWLEPGNFIKLIITNVSVFMLATEVTNNFTELFHWDHNIIMVCRRGLQNTAHETRSGILHDVEIKFYWNTATFICLPVLYSCFHTTIAELSHCDRDYVSHKA